MTNEISTTTDRTSLRPKMIDIPEDNPFKFDLLGRRPFVDTLAHTLLGIEGPAVFAIDGPWGTGKTTFVRMLRQHLLDKDARVVTINAWETDYVGDPLGVLASTIVDEVSTGDDSTREAFKKSALKLLRVVGPSALRIATGGLLNLDTAIEGEIGALVADAAERRLKHFEEDRESMRGFRKKLHEFAASCSSHPLIVIVDELDRCRPNYAVEMLEVIKHLFDVENVLFVLAVNRKQLDESVRMLYGTPSDPESYFRRFFDVELRLPHGDRQAFARSALAELGLPDSDLVAGMFVNFLTSSPYSIRVLEQTIRHYNLVRLSLRNFEGRDWWWMLTTALILRLVDEEAYGQFLRGRMTDAELKARILKERWIQDAKWTSQIIVIEATLMAVTEKGGRHSFHEKSELLAKYQKILDQDDPLQKAEANSIMTQYLEFIGGYSRPERLWPVVTECIEMLASKPSPT